MPVYKRDVSSLSKSGSAKLKGDVTLSEGSNVTLTQSGNDISIASTGSGGGQVDSVVAGTNIDVDATDPANPVVSVETLTLADISDVTASTAEVNVLDGVTASTAELNLLDGVTSTTAELNYTDGVTSAIQTQLDGKQPLDSDLTTIAGLTATTDNFIQSKSSAWASRTPAQVAVDLLPYVYPVGCIYFSTNSTNPATSLGFGTWSAFGAGRVPVGFDSGQTEFDTDEETGGSKEVTLTADQSGVPAHTHGVTDPGHTHSFTNVAIQDTGSGTTVLQSNAGAGVSGSNTTGITVNNNSTADASQAHTNLQPYIVVRMWKRTA